MRENPGERDDCVETMSELSPESVDRPLPGARATLGQLLRAHRKALGLTLDELALRVGRAKSYLSQLENDRRRPPRDAVLVELERALGLARG